MLISRMFILLWVFYKDLGPVQMPLHSCAEPTRGCWGGGGTWPMFVYMGAAEGLKSWPCLGQKYFKNPTLCRTTASISRPCLGQETKHTLSGFTGI